jgi:CIC family chloride channel protein
MFERYVSPSEIRARLDSLNALVRSYLSRVKASEYVLMMILAALIGLGGGFGAVGFRYLIRLVQWAAFGSFNCTLDVIRAVPWYFLIFIPAVGGVVIYPLISRLAKEAKGHGVPEVMEAVALRGGVIRPRIVLVKAVASAICIGTGGSVGREGPIVQIGSAFGSTIGQILRLSASRVRTLVGCGAAAGIAGTFNSPIAGALFAVEVILGDFGVPQFTPIVISSVVSTAVSWRFLGNSPAFIVPSYELVSAYELLPYALLGLMAGGIGVTFSTLVYKSEDLFDGLKIPGFTKPLIGGLIIGILAIGFPHILGVGYEAIDMALANKMTWYLLLTLVFLKLVATSLTLGSGGSGGIFAPSLFLGAMIGGFWGTLVHHFLPSITATAGAYAMVGMGAMVAATTHAPLTAMIIIFEMTGDYKIILPLMAACVIATVLAGRLKKTSIYTEKLMRRGIEVFEPLEINILKKFPVSHVIDRKPVVIEEGTSFKELLDLVVHSARSEFFVVRDGRRYVGTVSMHQMRKVLQERDWLHPLIIARDMADSTYPVLTPEDKLDMVMKLFTQVHADELPVVSDHKLVGSVRKMNVLEAYHQELVQHDLSGTFLGAMACVPRTKCVDLGEGYIMAEVEIPSYFAGKTLRDLNVRSDYGVEVILIRQAKKFGWKTTIVPLPDYRLAHGDVLLIAGEEKDVRRLAG